MRDFLGSKYVAGLWKTSMVRDLCWKVGDSRHDKVSHRPRVYCAPSWSWASVTGTIYFDILARQAAGATKLELAEVLDVQTQPHGTDPTGSLERVFLRVRVSGSGDPVKPPGLYSSVKNLQGRRLSARS